MSSVLLYHFEDYKDYVNAWVANQPRKGFGEYRRMSQALGVSTGPVVPLVSYAVATLFATVGFVPGGIGLVEVSTAAVLHSFGVPLGVALAAAVCARVAEFWIPLAVGAAIGHRYIATDSGVGV